MTSQQWIQLAVFLLVFGSGAIKWLYTRLQEQAAKKREQSMLAKQGEEQLRTGPARSGQSVFTSSAAPEATPQTTLGQDPQQRLRELARSRQEQLRSMREKARPAAPANMSAPATSAAERPAAPVVPRAASPTPRAPAQAANDPQAAQRRRALAKQQRQREAAQARARQEAQQEALERAERVRAVAMIAAAAPDAYATTDGRKVELAVSFGASTWTPQRVREAFVISEILGQPLALRPAGGMA